MITAWRVTRKRHSPYDGTGARLIGARWNSSGRSVIYAADSYAGSILEILAHSTRPRTLPGPHHAVRIDIPGGVSVEALDPAALPGWEGRGSPEARAFGDGWYDELRSAVLIVPALPSRPIGRNLLIHPAHPDAARIVVSPSFDVPWDERIF